MTYINSVLAQYILLRFVLLVSVTVTAVACGEPASTPGTESTSGVMSTLAPSTTSPETNQPQPETVPPLQLQNSARPTPIDSDRRPTVRTITPTTSSNSSVAQDPRRREAVRNRQGVDIVPSPTRAMTTSVSSSGSAPGKLAISILAEITVAPEHTSGYSRDEWRHWIDSDGDGCDTRQEVLAAESITEVAYEAGRCRVSSGKWISAYDNKETTDPSDLDIDHLVALAEAHESGGWSWNSETRRAYANDLLDDRHLIAVSASSNRSKGANDPNSWLPTNSAYRCRYISDWIAVKHRWSLSMDASEHRAISEMLNADCRGTRILAGNSQTSVVIRTVSPSVRPDASAQRVASPNAESSANCHPAYEPCLPNRPGDAINCGDLSPSQKPVRVKVVGVDPYRLDRDNNGVGCTS